MEAAGAASALVGLIAFSGDVLCAGYGYIHKVSKAPAEMRMLLSEVASLNMLFSRLQVLAEDSKDSLFDSALKSLDELGVFRDCVKLIKSVQESVDKCREVNGEEMRNLGRRLLWPFKEKETKDTIKQLERLRDTISTALAVDSA
jgi:precorrin-6B methylase 1